MNHFNSAPLEVKELIKPSRQSYKTNKKLHPNSVWIDAQGADLSNASLDFLDIHDEIMSRREIHPDQCKVIVMENTLKHSVQVHLNTVINKCSTTLNYYCKNSDCVFRFSITIKNNIVKCEKVCVVHTM